MRTVLLCLLTLACETETHEEAAERRAKEAWVGPCHDTATLVATTAGSPSQAECPNRLHRMRIEVTAAPSNEEFGAVVFCECQRADGGAQ